MLAVDVTGDEADSTVVLRARVSVWSRTSPRTRNCCPLPGEHAEQIAPLLDVFSGAVSRRTLMDIVYRCCAGLDVHKKTVVACVRRLSESGKVRKEVRTFGTMTADLLALSDWLSHEG